MLSDLESNLSPAASTALTFDQRAEQIQGLKHLMESVSTGQITMADLDSKVVFEGIRLLNEGIIRVASLEQGEWVVHTWIKTLILAYFIHSPMETIEVGPFSYFDKIPLKTCHARQGVRVVPPAVIRFGSYLESGVIVMPAYVNIGAWVGKNTMIDTWASVGSCAQIGENVHLSGGVGIGGVLEPLQARPVIVEDGAFIGSRSIVVEGVHIGHEAVLAANTSLTASTPIFDVRFSKKEELRGYIPPRSVVIPGTHRKIINGHEAFLNCAYIIGNRTASTDKKTSLNDVLRKFDISV